MGTFLTTMPRIVKTLYLALLCVWVLGCRTTTKPTGVKTILNNTNAHVRVVHYDATRRGMYVVQHSDGDVRIAAEPPPDAAMAVAAELLASTTGVGNLPTGGQIGGKLSEQIVELAGRGQVVTLARDALYRLAEMYVNKAVDKEQYLKQYSQILNMITELVEAEAKRVNLPETLIQSAVERARLSDAFTKDVLKVIDDVQQKYVEEIRNRGIAEGNNVSEKAIAKKASEEAATAKADLTNVKEMLNSTRERLKALDEERISEKKRADDSDKLRKKFMQSLNTVRAPLQNLLADPKLDDNAKMQLKKILNEINEAEISPAAP